MTIGAWTLPDLHDPGREDPGERRHAGGVAFRRPMPLSLSQISLCGTAPRDPISLPFPSGQRYSADRRSGRKSSDLTMNLTSSVQGDDEIAELDVVELSWAAENWRYPKAVNFRIAGLKAGILGLTCQSNHEVLVLPLASVQFRT